MGDAPKQEQVDEDGDDVESKNTEAIIQEVSNGVFGINSANQEGANQDDLFFPTEVETHVEPSHSVAQIRPPALGSQTEQAVSQSNLELQRLKNNQVVSRQLTVVNQQDKYLDLDARIFENYNKQIKDKGWTRERRTAAKLPPSVLFGLQKSTDNASQGTAATRTGAASLHQRSFAKNQYKDGPGLPKMSSAAHLGKDGNRDRHKTAQSRQSSRTARHGQLSVRNKLPQQSSHGLGFSAFDIGVAQGVNIDRLLRRNQPTDVDNKFTEHPTKAQQQSNS